MARTPRRRRRLYGLLAEFDSAAGAARRGRARRARPATRRPTRSRRFRSTGSPRRSASTSGTVAPIVLGGGLVGLLRRLRPRVLDAGRSRYPLNIGGRPFHAWRGVHPAGVRDDDPRRRRFAAVIGDARAERAAAAVPPGVQRAALPRGEPGQVLPASSRPPTRSSTARQTRQFLAGLAPARGGGR